MMEALWSEEKQYIHTNNLKITKVSTAENGSANAKQ